MTNTSTLTSVERGCAELLRNGQTVKFTAVAAYASLGSTALCRGPVVRATIDHNRYLATT